MRETCAIYHHHPQIYQKFVRAIAPPSYLAQAVNVRHYAPRPRPQAPPQQRHLTCTCTIISDVSPSQLIRAKRAPNGAPGAGQALSPARLRTWRQPCGAVQSRRGTRSDASDESMAEQARGCRALAWRGAAKLGAPLQGVVPQTWCTWYRRRDARGAADVVREAPQTWCAWRGETDTAQRGIKS